MATQTARTDKGKPAAKAAKRSKITHEEVRDFDRQFEQDLRTARHIADHITREEFIYLTGAMGTRHFVRRLLRVLGKANSRRDKTLNSLLDRVVTLTRDGVEGLPGYPTEARFVDTVIRTRLDKYDGPPTFKSVLRWVDSELDFYFRAKEAIADVERAERIRFLAIYFATQSDARDGAWSILKNCVDLGASAQEVGEIVQTTYSKLWQNISDWMDEGEAQLSTRVYAFARAQALGWRAERIRSKAPNDLEELEARMIAMEDSGKLPPRPVSLGPDDKVSVPKRARNLRGVSLAELWNPFPRLDRKFTDEELAAELRKAGPFRA